MFYTVGEMAKRMGVAASTLRYYDKEGLLPFVERSDRGIRMFKDSDMESLAMIECLKKTGMSIKDIKLFMDLCADGDSTIDARLQLIDRQRDSVTAQIDQLQQTLATLNYKHWFYQTAAEGGSTAYPKSLPDEAIPPEILTSRKNLCGR